MHLWPSQPSNQYSFHQQPKFCLKSKWSNCMFSNLKGVGSYLKELVSNTIGQWFDVNLGSVFSILCGNPYSHSLENKNLSNHLQTWISCTLDHVKDTFLRGGSINSLSLMKSSNSLMLRVILEPPNFSKILLVTLKFPPTHHLGKVKPKRSWSSTQKSLLRWEVVGP